MKNSPPCPHQTWRQSTNMQPELDFADFSPLASDPTDRSNSTPSDPARRRSCNDYSAPTAYGFREVLVKGFVDEVAIICGASEIARHPRVYGRGHFVFDQKHYLALLEQKPGALDQAAPLQNWALPEPLQHLRRLLEGRMGNQSRQTRVYPGVAAGGGLSQTRGRRRSDGRDLARHRQRDCQDFRVKAGFVAPT